MKTVTKCRYCGDIEEELKEHVKEGWHLYNISLRLKNMRPLTRSQYDEERLKAYTVKDADETNNIYCEPCRKKFKSKNSFESHVQSNLHKKNVETKVQVKQPPKLALSEEFDAKKETQSIDSDEFEKHKFDGGEFMDFMEEYSVDKVRHHPLKCDSCLLCEDSKKFATHRELSEHCMESHTEMFTTEFTKFNNRFCLFLVYFLHVVTNCFHCGKVFRRVLDLKRHFFYSPHHKRYTVNTAILFFITLKNHTKSQKKKDEIGEIVETLSQKPVLFSFNELGQIVSKLTQKKVHNKNNHIFLQRSSFTQDEEKDALEMCKSWLIRNAEPGENPLSFSFSEERLGFMNRRERFIERNTARPILQTETETEIETTLIEANEDWQLLERADMVKQRKIEKMVRKDISASNRITSKYQAKLGVKNNSLHREAKHVKN